ncbi:hypothetical protein DPMN_001322 [Dreissena polymorpha]|uniref:Uncharacterized protein n=1 Tax=Dreissena polymorpha TaxID=45954 RepID=A0A9D4RST7_DREPO|nr:hypothetical protein DPMN_001322 [Dreissena polymorpha]
MLCEILVKTREKNSRRSLSSADGTALLGRPRERSRTWRPKRTKNVVGRSENCLSASYHCTTNKEELRTNVVEVAENGLGLTENGIPTGTMEKLNRFELDKDGLATG